jgi:NAD+ kinase
VLHVAPFLGGQPVPLVPIKMGTVNFLGELEPDELPAALEPCLAGDFWPDERAMLAARTSEGAAAARRIGLNDAVLARAETPRVARIEVVVNQTALVCYACDGVIVSTATGSTPYSLAAGGPVLTPQSCCLIITAVAPRFSSFRSLVVPETAHVRLVNRGPCQLCFSVDAQLGQPVAPGGALDVAIAPERCSFARRGDREAFYRRLAASLGRKPGQEDRVREHLSDDWYERCCRAPERRLVRTMLQNDAATGTNDAAPGRCMRRPSSGASRGPAPSSNCLAASAGWIGTLRSAASSSTTRRHWASTA